MGVLDLAASTLIKPIVLSFALGLFAALVRSDLSIPEAVAKGMSLYLLFAIGFKGGVSVADHGVDLQLGLTLIAGVILSALWLVTRTKGGGKMDSELMREILLNGSIVLLVGAFFIGMITGQDGLKEIEALIVAPFKGVLCLFLLDMGLIAGRGLRRGRI